MYSSINIYSSSLIKIYDEDLMYFINFDSSKENGLFYSKIHNNLIFLNYKIYICK